MVKSKAVYIVLGVTREGEGGVPGLWIADRWRDRDVIQWIKPLDDGAGFWPSAMNERRNRGVRDILVAVVDGLKGVPEAIMAAFPGATVQSCIVHLTRHSMNVCGWKDRRAVAAGLRPICEAPAAEEAATKPIFLAIRTFGKGGRAVGEWVAARNQLAVTSAGRFDA